MSLDCIFGFNYDSNCNLINVFMILITNICSKLFIFSRINLHMYYVIITFVADNSVNVK